MRGYRVTTWYVLLVLGLAVLAAEGPAWAAPIPQGRHFAVERPLLEAEGGMLLTYRQMVAVLDKLPLEIPRWTSHTGFEPFAFFYYSLLRDETWSDWQNFVRSGTTVIPLGSARQVLFMVHAGYMEKRPLSRTSTLPKRKEAYLAAMRYLAYQPPPRRLGFLRLDKPEPKRSRWNLFSVLTEEEGVFSGRPWSWDNFLPRLFTVVVMLVGGLLGVEVLRFILTFGRRLSVRQNRRPGGSQEDA